MDQFTAFATVAGTVALVLAIGVIKTQGWVDAEYANYAMVAVTTGGGGYIAGKATNRPAPSPNSGG